MNRKILYALWAGMFVLCAGLGFIPQPEGAGSAVLTVVGILFFVPGFLLLYDGIRQQDRKAVDRLRNLAAISLGATLAALILNFLCVTAPPAVGDVLYWLLILVSTPMVCSQIWVVSLFLWAFLLFAAISRRPKNSQ